MLLDLIERFKFRGKLPRGKPPRAFAAEVHEYLEAAGVSKLRISEIIESATGRGVIGREWVPLKNSPSGCLYSNGEEIRARYRKKSSKIKPGATSVPPAPLEVYPCEPDLSIPNTQFWRTGRRR
jgi:hypothetical protein